MSLMAAIHSALTPDLLRGRWKTPHHPFHPLAGHCYVASETLWHSLPDKQDWKPMCYSWDDYRGRATHWWLQHRVTGAILDPTASQFCYDFPYSSGRGCGFLTKHPSKRAQIVLDRIAKAPKMNLLDA